MIYRTLGEILTLQRGFDTTKKEQITGEFPVISSSGITSYHNEYKAKGPGVVIGRKGTLGTSYFIESNYWPHDTTLWVKDFKGNNEYYVYCLLKVLPLEKLDSGSANPTLNRNYAHQLKVPFIPQEVQKKTIEIIRLLNDKIEINNNANVMLEAMAKTIYDYWFLQFDFPNEEGKPYRSSGGKMVWNEKLKREIPEGWEVQSIAKNSLFKLIKPGVDTFEVKTYLATADVNGTSFGGGNLIEFETRENRANMQPSINSVWFAKMKNSIKHLFLNEAMSELIESTILSTGFCGIQCTETSFEYIASYISSPQFEITKDALAHGATQQAVNNEDLHFIKMVIPEGSVLNLYHEIAKDIYNKISNNKNENQELVKLRDWLLPMLMNGQVTVEERASENE